MNRPQFRLRSLFTLVLLAAILLGWWTDRRQLAESLNEATELNYELAAGVNDFAFENAVLRFELEDVLRRAGR